MQKIIDGLRYDTDTATRIFKHRVRATMYGRPTGKLTRKALYKTPNGRWFIHETALANPSQGEDIKPISVSDAQAYLRPRLADDAFATHFPGIA